MSHYGYGSRVLTEFLVLISTLAVRLTVTVDLVTGRDLAAGLTLRGPIVSVAETLFLLPERSGTTSSARWIMARPVRCRLAPSTSSEVYRTDPDLRAVTENNEQR